MDSNRSRVDGWEAGWNAARTTLSNVRLGKNSSAPPRPIGSRGSNAIGSTLETSGFKSRPHRVPNGGGLSVSLVDPRAPCGSWPKTGDGMLSGLQW